MLARVSSGPPVVMLAFANDRTDDERYLRNLAHEQRTIRQALRSLVEQRKAELHVLTNATVADVVDAFASPDLADRVVVLHYGGHADGSTLMLEDDEGGRAPVDAQRLAEYVARQERLVLVFLNGCATKAQVQRLRELGVPAVVATSRAIKDDLASEFAGLFYQHLRAYPLGKAFGLAVAAAQLQVDPSRQRPADAYRADYRELLAPVSEEELEWPWLLEHEPGVEHWRLVPTPPPARLRTRRWLAATVAAALGLVVGGWAVFGRGPAHDARPPVDPPRAEAGNGGHHETGPHEDGSSTSPEPDVGEPPGDDLDDRDLPPPTPARPPEPGAAVDDETTARRERHCKIDADYQNAWRPRCAEGRRPRTEPLRGALLRDYKATHPELRSCDTITLYSCP